MGVPLTHRVNDTEVELSIWDTAGQERFRSLITNFYRGSRGIVLCYDVSEGISADSIREWVEGAQEAITEQVVWWE